jgi:hypothetical protein
VRMYAMTTWNLYLLCDGGDGHPHPIGGVEPIKITVPTRFLVAAAPYLKVVGFAVKLALKITMGVTVPGLIDVGGGVDLSALWDANADAVNRAAGDAGSDAVAAVAGVADAAGLHAAMVMVTSVSDRALDELEPILDANKSDVRRFGLGHAVLEGRGHVWLCGACTAACAAAIARPQLRRRRRRRRRRRWGWRWKRPNSPLRATRGAF